MEENLIAGVVLCAAALPGIGLGVAILTGKLRFASLAAARDPERARVATGAYLIGLDTMLMVLGVLLIAAKPAQVDTIAGWGTAIIVALATLGVLPLLRAARS